MNLGTKATFFEFVVAIFCGMHTANYVFHLRFEIMSGNVPNSEPQKAELRFPITFSNRKREA